MACINNHRCGTCPHPCKSEVKDVEHQKWYSSLTIAEKELVAGAEYPKCTVLWNSWTQDERQDAIAKSGLNRRRGNKECSLGHDF